MGNSPSKSKPKDEERKLLNDQEAQVLEHPAFLSLRKHLRVKEREQIRQIPYKSEKEAGIDLLADSYDFLIVLPNPDFIEQKLPIQGIWSSVKKFGRRIFKMEENDEGEDDDDEEVLWEDAKKMWLKISKFGMDEREQVLVLARIWGIGEEEIDSQTSKSKIKMKEWKRVILKALVDVLSSRSGLQLKIRLSRDQQNVFIRLRAPFQLLEDYAEKTNHRLQLAWEVDPGYEFWNEEEVNYDAKAIGFHEASKQLELMYHANKIPASESILDASETPHRLKLKMRVLERIADHVPVHNRYPAHCEFKKKHRHLFQTYHSGRGSSIFRPKDRLCLTQKLIDECFNVDQCREIADNGSLLPIAILALHDGNQGDRVTIHSLMKRWVFFWESKSDKVGAPMVSMRAMDEGHRPLWIFVPFSQPLEDIKDYFGEKFGLYFAWLGFYTLMMGVLALFVVVVLYIGLIIPYVQQWKLSTDAQLVLLTVLLTIWTSVHERLWKREERLIQLKWGTTDLEEQESVRPQFEPDEMTWDPVTNEFKPYYPKHKRQLKQLASCLIVILFIGGLLCSIVFVNTTQVQLTTRGYTWADNACSLVLAIQIQVLSTLYANVVTFLNEWENHYTETTFENNLVFKTFLFQLFNNYASLLYTAFLKAHINGCLNTCMGDLRSLMKTIFITQYLTNIAELGIPWYQTKMKEKEEENQYQEALKKEQSEKKRPATNEASDPASPNPSKESAPKNNETVPPPASAVVIEQFEREAHLEEFESLFNDFAEMVIQYGTICFFMLAFPLAPVLAAFQNLIEVRVDAFKYCRLTSRPDADTAESLAVWEHLMSAIGWAGCVINPAIFCFTTDALSGFSLTNKWVFFLVFEQILVGLKITISSAISDNPKWVQEIARRQAFIIQKYVHGMTGSLEDRVSEKSSQYSAAEDLSTFVQQLSKNLTGRQLRELKIKKKEIDKKEKQIQNYKSTLRKAYETEIMNKDTGIAETKTGIPLGRLDIELVSVTGMSSGAWLCINMGLTDRAVSAPTKASTPISKKHGKSGPSLPQKNYVARLGDPPSKLGEQSQISDPFFFPNTKFQIFPIGTKEAEVIVKIVTEQPGKDMVDIPADTTIGYVKVALHELDSQLEELITKPFLQEGHMRKEKAGMKITMKMRFMYSKVLPILEMINILEQEKKQLETDIFEVAREKKQKKKQAESETKEEEHKSQKTLEHVIKLNKKQKQKKPTEEGMQSAPTELIDDDLSVQDAGLDNSNDGSGDTD